MLCLFSANDVTLQCYYTENKQDQVTQRFPLQNGTEQNLLNVGHQPITYLQF